MKTDKEQFFSVEAWHSRSTTEKQKLRQKMSVSLWKRKKDWLWKANKQSVEYVATFQTYLHSLECLRSKFINKGPSYLPFIIDLKIRTILNSLTGLYKLLKFNLFNLADCKNTWLWILKCFQKRLYQNNTISTKKHLLSKHSLALNTGNRIGLASGYLKA